MKISNWPLLERPREKLLKLGVQSLSDAEVLAIMLGTGLPGINSVDLAREILADFGSLRAIFNASKKRLCQARGMGEAKYCLLLASAELFRRSMAEDMVEPLSFTDATATANYLSAQLRGQTSEVFAMLLLNSQHQLIAYRQMFQGTINAAAVYPRELVKQAIEDNAAAVILAHNHPSGIAEPSQSDIGITEKIKQAMALIDVRVLDHFIVGKGAAVSLAQRGLI